MSGFCSDRHNCVCIIVTEIIMQNLEILNSDNKNYSSQETQNISGNILKIS